MITIYGQCPSKSNSYRIGYKGLYKTDKLKKYEKDFLLQLPKAKSTIEGEFEIIILVYYDSRRPDIDNSLKVILDCLQKESYIPKGKYEIKNERYIRNDNKCVNIDITKRLDKKNPRIMFWIKEDEYSEVTYKHYKDYFKKN